MARKCFDHEQFNFEFQVALGGVHYYGAGDIGEMLSPADRVVDGDADSWCEEWIATAQLGGHDSRGIREIRPRGESPCGISAGGHVSRDGAALG